MTLTLDWVILHTIMHHSLTSTYTLNFTEIEETICGWTDVHTDRWTDKRAFEAHFIRSTLRRVDLKTIPIYRISLKSDHTLKRSSSLLIDSLRCDMSTCLVTLLASKLRSLFLLSINDL